MSKTITREILIPKSREEVWQAITRPDTLAQWMFPNDFEPQLGHQFTFQVPPNPETNFQGLTVRCEVLECEPPHRLVFSWTVGGPIVDTRVRFQLEADGDGTRLYFEHAGIDVSQPGGTEAFHGARYGWTKMLRKLVAVVTGEAPRERSES